MADRKAPPIPEPTVKVSEPWSKLPWKKFEKHVFRIQKRIYRASQHGKTRAVQKLQKLLMKSQAARLLAVRRVTQDNQGKKTAGIDGVKSVPPNRRLVMAEQIRPKHWKRSKPRPVRRVWIPKPGKAEKRPLGIPTMLNRAEQALGKMALEPEWEAKFEGNSYGFRPGRSCHDAIDAIFEAIRYKAKFVFDADIKGCFDNINQEALLEKLHTYPAMRRLIEGWLKAGVLERDGFTPTEAGTPQGGVASPLLANIALHGMEDAIAKGYRKGVEKPILIRYADDLVILHSDKAVLGHATQTVTDFLEGIGLYFNPKKTRVTHTLTPYEGNVGFDFLGFTVRQFPVGKTHTGKDTHGRPLGFKTIIKPSKEAVKRHLAETRSRIRKLRAKSQPELIKDLNPVIRGWSNYYRTVVSTEIFSRCDWILHHQLMRWSRRRHPNKGMDWIVKKYWRADESRTWVFATPEGAEVRTHSQTHIHRHTKVKGTASPYDGDLLYWSQRLKNHPMLKEKLGRLLQKQQGKCRWCELTLQDGDRIEIDHIDRDRNNNVLSNLMVLHLHCHDERHAKLNEHERTRASTGINHK